MLEEVTITDNTRKMTGIAHSASEGTVTAQQLSARPLLRPAEVMEAMPGMIVTQHSGDGKANQYFLRGFNLDHGSDFATYVNGAPVNNLTHAHGQGYMDLNFLIPELVGNLRYRKGMYAAQEGDLSVTGATRIYYLRKLPTPFLDITLGANEFRRALLAGSHDMENGMSLLGALELAGNNGPWLQAEHLQKTNAVLRLSSGTASRGHALTALAYDARWIATEHVPERAILNNEISRYGTLAPTDGGRTHRYQLTGEWASPRPDGAIRAQGYVVDYGLNLYSTPSGLLDGQHEQIDQRMIWGGQMSRTWLLGESWKNSEATLGWQYRQDDIRSVGLYPTYQRQRTGVVRADQAQQNSYGLSAETHTQWQPWLRTTLGARWDSIHAEITPKNGAFNSSNGGRIQASQFSPKLGLIMGPSSAWPDTEFFLNAGHGFHSNDARGATTRTHAADGSVVQPIPLIVKATGSEIGVRTHLLPGWNSSLTLWQTRLASELIFIGDEGVTEPQGASQRHGVEWSNHYAHSQGFIIEADVAVSKARLVQPINGGSRVPNAVPVTASFAATYDPADRWYGGIRLRYLGAYPLEESGQQKSQAFWIANLKLGYRASKSLQLSLDVLNLFDSKANDIEYWGASCTAREAAACNGGNGFDGRLVHPLEPRTWRFSVRMNY